MLRQAKIEIPPGVSFLDLGLHKDSKNAVSYNMRVLKSMLTHNNIGLEQLTQADLMSLLAMWYIRHRKNDGEPDMAAELLFEPLLSITKYKPSAYWGATIEPPTPEQIKALRKHTGMTQPQVAKLLNLSNRQLIGDYENGVKSPSPQTWTLWLLLTDQHPTLTLSDRQVWPE